jgi:hypothetical protein
MESYKSPVSIPKRPPWIPSDIIAKITSRIREKLGITLK